MLIGGLLLSFIPNLFWAVSIIITVSLLSIEIYGKLYLRDPLYVVLLRLIAMFVAWPQFLSLVSYLLLHDDDMTYHDLNEQNKS